MVLTFILFVVFLLFTLQGDTLCWLHLENLYVKMEMIKLISKISPRIRDDRIFIVLFVQGIYESASMSKKIAINQTDWKHYIKGTLKQKNFFLCYLEYDSKINSEKI